MNDPSVITLNTKSRKHQPKFFSVEPTNDYSSRYFPDRVGSSAQQGSNIRAMFRGRENLSHKYTGTISNKIVSIFLHQREKSEGHALSDTQRCSLVLSFKNGGNKERTYEYIKQRDLALSSKSQNVYHNKYMPSALNTVADMDSRKNQTTKSDAFIPKFFK